MAPLGPNESERRRYERFAIQGNAFAVLLSDTPRLGQIIDISRGGMSFRYVDDAGAISDRADLDIFLLNQPVLMKSVAVRSRCDFQIEPRKSSTSETVRRCCVEFVALGPGHSYALDELLQHHTQSMT
ncbi:MAG: PilZ domain-containing protein [Desulfobacterales bacterium]|nr:PilZ domain-containing protein [Desulfobacterales bacterium]